MAANIEESLIEKLRGLPLEKQQEVLDFVESLADQTEARGGDDRPIWEVIKEIGAEVPDEEWARLPTDGAEQHDHYLYGAKEVIVKNVFVDTLYWVAVINPHDQWHERAYEASGTLGGTDVLTHDIHFSQEGFQILL